MKLKGIMRKKLESAETSICEGRERERRQKEEDTSEQV